MPNTPPFHTGNPHLRGPGTSSPPEPRDGCTSSCPLHLQGPNAWRSRTVSGQWPLEGTEAL